MRIKEEHKFTVILFKDLGVGDTFKTYNPEIGSLIKNSLAIKIDNDSAFDFVLNKIVQVHFHHKCVKCDCDITINNYF